jgi:hypothetical protein
MNGIRRKGLLALLTCLACGSFVPPAQATFHITQIREIYPGSSGASFQDAYVELQAWAAGQNFLGGHHFSVYNSAGTPDTFTVPSNVSNGQNQATFLIGDQLAMPRDFFDDSLDSTLHLGGAVCWENIDCVSFGSGPGMAVLPSPAGTPVPLPPNGMALGRNITRGCATQLDAADDTNNSAADFSAVAPNPRNNASPITETPCALGVGVGGDPNTTIKRRPKNRSADDSPTYKFRSDEVGSTFKCKLDHKKFHKCKSPKTYHGVAPGKHTFKVEAIDADGNADPTPAKDKFKVLP